MRLPRITFFARESWPASQVSKRRLSFSSTRTGCDMATSSGPTLPSPPIDWQVRESPPGEVQPQETGWVVKDLPAGFAKVVEGFRTLRGKSAPVAHLVFSDGLVAVSVFVEPVPPTPQPVGLSQQGGINVYSRQLDDYLVTVLGEAPGATVRQIAYSVAHR